MKSIFLAFIVLFLAGNEADAQIKSSDKAEIKTPAITCDVCKDRIEFFLGREYGVTSIKADIRKKTTTVTWLTDRTNIETIRAAIANLGFDADDVEAEESAYKRLPKECKKPVEKPKTAPVGII
ncbi:MAG: cation transporter [Chitinophagaceae bacterium]